MVRAKKTILTKLFWLFYILGAGMLIGLSRPLVIEGFSFWQLGFVVFFQFAFYLFCYRKIKRFFWSRFFAFLIASIGNLFIFYWLAIAMHNYGGMALGLSIGGVFFVALTLAFFEICFLEIAFFIHQKKQLPFFLVLAICLTTKDFMLHYFPFGGFSWGIPAYALSQYLDFFQWLDILGSLGLCFFIYLVNGLILHLLGWVPDDRSFWRFKKIAGLSLAFAFGLSLVFSFGRAYQFDRHAQEFKLPRLALIQASIKQDLKWDQAQFYSSFRNHLELSQKAIAQEAKLLIWPETALTILVPKNKVSAWTNQFFGDYFNVEIIFGTVLTQKSETGIPLLYNSALHFNPKKRQTDSYSKRHLVPFGEYVPLTWLFGQFVDLTSIGAFQTSSQYNLFEVNGVKIAPQICYEDLFMRYSYAASQKNADVILNITNDAWYGHSSAQLQHLNIARFRALENRLPFIRATNDGISAVIDAKGKILRSLGFRKRNILLFDQPLKKAKSLAPKLENWPYVLSFGFLFLLGYRLLFKPKKIFS